MKSITIGCLIFFIVIASTTKWIGMILQTSLTVVFSAMGCTHCEIIEANPDAILIDMGSENVIREYIALEQNGHTILDFSPGFSGTIAPCVIDFTAPLSLKIGPKEIPFTLHEFPEGRLVKMKIVIHEDFLECKYFFSDKNEKLDSDEIDPGKLKVFEQHYDY